ncbi:MAG TPA: transcriptional regulator NrdR [Candidatus Absconditabacterales bacterium]|nr:transcriptional regulator NrdR [Candidatus Absconditabacterales bacterium]
MKCPKCQNVETKVVDSRMIEDGQTIRRRRECEFCGNRFTTFERKGFTELMVIKKDKTKEMYDRQKLKKSLMLSFAKREFNNEKIENLLNNLENKRISEGTEISSKQIGDDILEMLKEIDPVVYIRFASVYKSFDSLEDFRNFIDD